MVSQCQMEWRCLQFREEIFQYDSQMPNKRAPLVNLSIFILPLEQLGPHISKGLASSVYPKIKQYINESFQPERRAPRLLLERGNSF